MIDKKSVEGGKRRTRNARRRGCPLRDGLRARASSSSLPAARGPPPSTLTRHFDCQTTNGAGLCSSPQEADPLRSILSGNFLRDFGSGQPPLPLKLNFELATIPQAQAFGARGERLPVTDLIRARGRRIDEIISPTHPALPPGGRTRLDRYAVRARVCHVFEPNRNREVFFLRRRLLAATVLYMTSTLYCQALFSSRRKIFSARLRHEGQ